MQKKYRKNKNFVYRMIQHETILVPIKDNVGDMGSLYNLNEVGAFIWERLDGEKTLHNIEAMIIEEFDVSSEKAQEDLGEFVHQLKEIDAILEVSNIK
ncbi:MAG: PqqD family protein [Deltaproteobacteria bacterium]|nr:PqqD family protein [Deltaproteobacteria bacterium]